MSETETNTTTQSELDEKSKEVMRIIWENDGKATTSDIRNRMDMKHGSIHYRFDKLKDKDLITEVQNNKQVTEVEVTEKAEERFSDNNSKEPIAFYHTDNPEQSLSDFEVLQADIENLRVDMRFSLAYIFADTPEQHNLIHNTYKSMKAKGKYQRKKKIKSDYENQEYTQKELAEKYDVSQSKVNNIVNSKIPKEPPEPPYDNIPMTEVSELGSN